MMSKPAWISPRAVLDPTATGNIAVDELLYEYDLPLIFTVRHGDVLALYYFAEHAEDGAIYIAAPIEERSLSELKAGARTLRETLAQPLIWVVDVDASFNARAAWRVSSASLPQEHLPKAHMMLWAHLEPVLNVRLTGPCYEPGSFPASALRDGIDAISDVVAKLTRAAGEAYSTTKTAISSVPQLQTQRMAFGSLEVSFGLPKNDPQRSGDFLPAPLDPWTDLGRRLERALDWAEHPLTTPTDVEADWEVLEALERFAPTPTTPFDKVEIGGKFFKSRRRFSLDRESAEAIRGRLQEWRDYRRAVAQAEEAAPRPESLEGRIRKFDKDKLEFHLKEQGRRKLIKCSIFPDLLDEALAYFVDDTPIRASGLLVGSALVVRTILPLQRLLT